MFRKQIVFLVLLSGYVMCHLFVVNEAFAAQPQPVQSQRIKPVTVKLPDLFIRQYKFVPNHDKGLRVQVANYGQKASQPCRLLLTIRKINGTPVGRKMYATIPAIQQGKTDWIAFDTTSILPKNVSLRDTTFKLMADATKVVHESNENNNETWHNK